MPNMLTRIVQHKRTALAETKQAVPLENLRARLSHLPRVRNFADAVAGSAQRGFRIIAEIKKASPSKGILREQFDVRAIARAYEDGGAAAVSVLTETNYFQGSLDYLSAVKAEIKLPVLRKDFIIDPYQLYEARVNGADAVLLIAAILTEDLLAQLLQLARELTLFHIVEVHDIDDVRKALAAGADIIGINNRNLKTFETNLHTTIELLPAIPDDKIIVSESGICSRTDMVWLANAGVDAFLIGETLMKEKDPGAKLREWTGRPT